MEVLFTVGTIFRIAVRVFMLLLWARLILEWVVVLNRNFRPRGGVAVAVELVYTVTDPPIRLFRRLLPPIRLGQISLDLGWLVTFIVCLILLALIPGYG